MLASYLIPNNFVPVARTRIDIARTRIGHFIRRRARTLRRRGGGQLLYLHTYVNNAANRLLPQRHNVWCYHNTSAGDITHTQTHTQHCRPTNTVRRARKQIKRNVSEVQGHYRRLFVECGDSNSGVFVDTGNSVFYVCLEVL